MARTLRVVFTGPLGRIIPWMVFGASMVSLACASSSRTQSPDRVAIDSATAVARAIAVLRKATSDTVRLYTVAAIARDDSGAVISLIPVAPPGGFVGGGSATIRVWNNGKTKILVIGI